MLRKLRIKFVLINMTIVTIMLGVILGVVYHSTKANLEKESIAMMQNMAAGPVVSEFPNVHSSEDIRLPFITLELSSKGQIVSASGGYYDLSDTELLQGMADQALSENRQIGELGSYNLRYCRMITPNGQVLVFTDMTSEQATLKNLLRTCLIIGSFGFLVFLGISILLAKWTVRPVEKAWQQQKQFVADASHELKTPLSVIMTNAELIKSRDIQPENKEHFCDGILEVGNHMKTLLEQMLQLARSDAGQVKLEAEKTDFSELSEEMALTYEAMFFENGLELNYDIEPECYVNCDRHQIMQLMDILLDNALKYSSSGGSVDIELKKSPQHKCRFLVRSPGKALSAKDLNQIFERFYRKDEARSSKGSYGLGLSIARNIADLHKGKIWAESQPGSNTFIVELPCTGG